MQKILLLIIFLVLSVKNYSQTKSVESADKDSTEILKDLMDLLSDSEKPASYFTIDVGIGNRIFNVQNKVLNSKFNPVSTFIYSPSLLYHHKSGLNFSGGINLLNDKKGFGIKQSSLSAGYELPENSNTDFSITYTHIFVNDIFSPYTSPVHNDLYAAYVYKKTWIRPGIAADYSGGEYGDVKRIRSSYDSISTRLKSFSLMASISHEFKWQEVFNKKDGIYFISSLMMNMGKSKLTFKHKTNVVNLANFLNKKGRLPKFENTKFQAESLGLSLDPSYVFGKFSIEPQGYFDYYLPATAGNKLASYFTLTISYYFQ
jgi:hypothetical protein